jgi:hypothetical protein
MDSKEQFRQPLYSLAGWYDNPIPTRFLAPIDCSKTPTQKAAYKTRTMVDK